MAEQVLVGATITADTKGAVESVGSLKKQLRDAQQDVQALADKFGATSTQAINAAKKAAELKDRIGDAKALTDAYNPDAKFKGFAQTLQGVVGGFTAVQGALGLVGVESDQVEKTLLKVQSAMALSQGLNTVLESVDAFKNFSKQIGLTSAAQKIYTFVMYGTAAATKATDAATKAASTSMRILRGLIATLGIGALIAGVTILISKISSWVGSTDSAKEANDRLNEAIDQQNKLFEKNRKALQNARQDAITEAKIKGASAEEIYKITKEYGQKDIDLTKQNAADKYKTLQEYEAKNLEVYYVNGQKRVRGDEAQVEQYKKLSKEYEDANNIKNDAIRQSDVDAQNEQLRIADEGRAKAKQNSAEAKQLAEKQKQERDKELEEEKQRLKEREEANKQADEQIRKAKQENYLASIKDEDERAKKKLQLDLENRNLEIEALNIDNSKKRELKFQAAIDTQNQLDALDIEIKKKQEEKDRELADRKKEQLDKTISDAQERQDAIRQATSTEQENELYNLQQQYKKKLELVKGNAEAEQALLKEYKEKEKQITELAEETKLQIISNALSGLADAVGRNTAAGKALAVAQAGIDTYAGANKALAAYPPPFGAIAAGTVVLAGLMNVKKILSTKLPKIPGSKGGGDSVAAPSISAAPPMSPQLPVQATLTQLNQGSINQLGSATNRAYVVETDITNSQERIKRINRAARLN